MWARPLLHEDCGSSRTFTVNGTRRPVLSTQPSCRRVAFFWKHPVWDGQFFATRMGEVRGRMAGIHGMICRGIFVLPKPVREQVCEPEQDHSAGGRGVKTVIERSIEYEIFSRSIGHGPKISDGIAAQQRLGEMPDFSGDCDHFQGMRNRKRLSPLRPPQHALLLFVGDPIGIEMEAKNISAHQNCRRLDGRADVDVRSRPGICGSKVAGRNRWTMIFAWQENHLRAGRDASGLERALAVRPAPDHGLGLQEELEPGMHRKLNHLLQADSA